MAFTDRGTLKVTLSLKDQSNKGNSSCQFYVGAASGNLPNIHDTAFRNFIGEFADNVAAVSDCFVESISVSLVMFNDATVAYGDAPDVERKGVLQFKTADGYSTIFTIPGAKYDMFGADGESIIRDPDDPEDFGTNPLATPLQSIHDKLRNGVTIAPNTYPVTDRRAKDVRAMFDAYKQHRKKSRG